MPKFFKIILTIIFIGGGIFDAGGALLNCAEAAVNLQGKILLQVQDKGQAWYVNPVNGQRYYLGRPADAFAVMRSLGLGISNNDLKTYLLKAPTRLAGRILLQVQDKGQAYYVDPQSLKLFYLGRPADAFAVMRSQGLGITNRDLETIPIAISELKPIAPILSATKGDFSFKYQNNPYIINQALSSSLYNIYKDSPKVLSYPVGNAPKDLREAFYALFLEVKKDDHALDEIVDKLKKIAAINKWSEDQTLEFVISFVQYIPYAQDKLTISQGANNNPYFPYETLYLNKGVCSDKTFLAVLLLRKLGYGAAILDFPEINHTALGVACPQEFSLNNSGYCYSETTNYFPLGVIPQSINKGQAQTVDEFTNLFEAGNLGKIEIYQKTTGKIYQGIPALISRIESLRKIKSDLDLKQSEINNLNITLNVALEVVSTLKNQLDQYFNNGQTSAYNNLVLEYNKVVEEYNLDLKVYQAKVSEYNAKISDFNVAVKLFYQQ